MKLTILFLAAGLLIPRPADANDGVGGCAVLRDDTGKIVRSKSVLRDFKRLFPCPENGHTSGACPGYVIDHVVPLCAGGCDVVENLQWQTAVAGREKDKLERFICKGASDD